MESKNLKSKLMNVERTINTYNQDNEFIEEINIDNIPFNALKEIVPPKVDDPLLYDGYLLNAKQLDSLNSLIVNKIAADFELYFYVLECAGIYDSERNEQKPQ